MVSSGLRDAGYVYFNLDDGWASDTRGTDGRLSADPGKFPEGMRNFSDYVHSKGLKLGLYTAMGTNTCAMQSVPGSTALGLGCAAACSRAVQVKTAVRPRGSRSGCTPGH